MATKYEYINESSILPDLICAICSLPFEDAVCCPCGHTFCRQCITRWISQEKRNCPLCQHVLTLAALQNAPHALRGILDALPVRCKICHQAELQRGGFEEHIQKICPKMVVNCSAADLQCPWKGQRDQLARHLPQCHYEGTRPKLSQLLNENRRWQDQVNRLTSEATKQQNNMREMRMLADQLTIENNRQRDRIITLNERLMRQTGQLNESQQQNQQLTEEKEELRTQVEQYRRENQRLTASLAEEEMRMQNLTLGSRK